MQIETHTKFADHYVANCATTNASSAIANGDAIQVLICTDLKAEVGKYSSQGFIQVGHAQFVGKGNLGVHREAREQAVKVGASVVLFTLVPCKLRAIRKDPSGEIDMQAVLDDPPSRISPTGHSVLTSAFLAKAQNEV